MHVPGGARGVIDVVFCSGRAESGSRIEVIASQVRDADDTLEAFLLAESRNRWTERIDRTIEMVCGHEFPHNPHCTWSRWSLKASSKSIIDAEAG